MKTILIYRGSAFVLFVLLFSIVFNGCVNEAGEVNPIPAKKSTKDGYAQDNARTSAIAVAPPPSGSGSDINPNTLGFNDSQSFVAQTEKPAHSVRITPGATINSKKYYRFQLQPNGTPRNDYLIVGIGPGMQSRTGVITVTDYHDINGRFLGKLRTVTYEDRTEVTSFTAGFTGSVDGSGWISRGFIGGWAKCVGAAIAQMSAGTVIGSVSGIACLIWGPYCAAAVGTGCAISAAGGVWG